MSNDKSGESQDLTTNDLLSLVKTGLESTSESFVRSVEALNRTSEKFSQRAPGQRASWLGFLLVLWAVSAEFVDAVSKMQFDMSDSMSMAILIMGGVLVAVGVAFDTYFTVKTAAAHFAQAASLEQKASEQRRDGLKLMSRLIGKGD